MLNIREVHKADHEVIWGIFHEIVSCGETYPYSPQISRQRALRIWIEESTRTYVAELNGEVVGTYYIKPNQPSLGSHVCNCGYMVPKRARGKGIGSAMCQHSLNEARRLGFQAMQFNLVVASNKKAVRLWQKLGFDLIGTLPEAFDHQQFGLVDAHVMYKWLGAPPLNDLDSIERTQRKLNGKS